MSRQTPLDPTPIFPDTPPDDRAPRLDTLSHFGHLLVALDRDSGGTMAWVLMS